MTKWRLFTLPISGIKQGGTMKPTEQAKTYVKLKNDQCNGLLSDGDKLAIQFAYMAGFNEAISQMQPEWVAVTERLPERDTDVYFYRLGTSEYVYEGKYVGAGFFKQGNIHYDTTVTHFIEKSNPQPPTDKH